MQDFAYICRLIWGKRWQTDAAAELGIQRKSLWLYERNPPPPYNPIWGELHGCLLKRQDEINKAVKDFYKDD